MVDNFPLGHLARKLTNEAKSYSSRLGFPIRAESLGMIRIHLLRKERDIAQAISRGERTSESISMSVEKLIEEATSIAADEGKTSIYPSHIAKAKKKICPTYFPFC